MLTDPVFPVTCGVSSTTWHSSAAKVPHSSPCAVAFNIPIYICYYIYIPITCYYYIYIVLYNNIPITFQYSTDAQKRDPQIWKAPSLTCVYANMLLDCWGSAEKKIACATKKEERRRTINSKERNLPASTIKFLPIRLVRLYRIKQVLAFSCAARSRRPPTRTLCLEPQQRHQGSSSGGETRSSSASAVGGGAGLP